MTLGNIIKAYREKTGDTMDSFAKKSGLSKAYISILERNINPISGKAPVPSLAKIKAVATSIGYDFNDLIAALDGDQLVSLTENDDEPVPPFDLPNILPLPNTYTVPLIGSIACGKPTLCVEEAEETVEVPDSIHADFALRCKGDSMINARIFEGDIVYIRAQPEVENGDIAAVRIDDEATLKKVYAYDGRLVLRAANPMYEDQVYTGDELNHVEILGLAVAFLSRIK